MEEFEKYGIVVASDGIMFEKLFRQNRLTGTTVATSDTLTVNIMS